MGIRPWTDRHSQTQTGVTTIHFASSTTHAKCNDSQLNSTHSLLLMADSMHRSSYDCHKDPLDVLGMLTVILQPRPCRSHSDSHGCAETCQLPLVSLPTMADNLRPVDETISWDQINSHNTWQSCLDIHICHLSQLHQRTAPLDAQSQPINHDGYDHGNSAINDLLTAAQRECNDLTTGPHNGHLFHWQKSMGAYYTHELQFSLQIRVCIVYTSACYTTLW